MGEGGCRKPHSRYKILLHVLGFLELPNTIFDAKILGFDMKSKSNFHLQEMPAERNSPKTKL